jgi:hypothetical protein
MDMTMADRKINDEGGAGYYYGPHYAKRVQKSKKNQVGWAIGYFIAAGALYYVGATAFVMPVIGLGVVTLIIAWALGKGYSNWLRVGLLLGLLGFGGWYILQLLPVLGIVLF